LPGRQHRLRLARALEKSSQVKLIERDLRRARSIECSRTRSSQRRCGDEELLIEENIDSADVFAAHNSEEANILSAMLANGSGTQGHALINKPSYADLMRASIDIAISLKRSRLARCWPTFAGDVVRVHSLSAGCGSTRGCRSWR